MATVQPGSFLTLHYRLAGPEGDVINTFEDKPATLTLGNSELSPVLEERLLGLEEGTRTSFDLPLAPQGTAFQLQVWHELARIPFGATISYAQLAQRIGKPEAVRAVGAANGRNPLPIVLPCHRVIGADGSLTGFSGGLPTKRFLLELEGALPRQTPPPDLFAT